MGHKITIAPLILKIWDIIFCFWANYFMGCFSDILMLKDFGSRPACASQGVLNVKLCTLECFTLYLRNRQSENLRAIENCVCSIRSIERNMTSFLRTVHVTSLNIW
jgi:hypothetical protein